jgi:hypothetical protein
MSKELRVVQLDLSAVLAQLGLSHHEKRLVENGFEDWETVTAIKESDMIEMGFTRSDRRELQRAINPAWVFDQISQIFHGEARKRSDNEHKEEDTGNSS